MENEDIPMPGSTYRLHRLVMEASIRQAQSERHTSLTSRLQALTQDTADPGKPQGTTQKRPAPADGKRLYVVLLDDPACAEELCTALQTECDCTEVVGIGATAWIVEAPDNRQAQIRDKVNDAVHRRYSVFVLELGARFAWAHRPDDRQASALLMRYPV